MKDAVLLENIVHEYDGARVLTLENWLVKPGDRWLLIGPSGCGKTTLLHIIAGLLAPTEGRVIVADQDLSTLSGAKSDRFRGQMVGIMFQRLHLIGALTVLGNLTVAQTLAGQAADAAQAMTILETIGLGEKARAYPQGLSQGQAQRVALARAVINGPALIIADEPTANLDDANAERVIDLLDSQAQANGSALIVATHDRRLMPRFSKTLELEAPT